MSNYLYRLARSAFRRRLVLAAWPAAAIAVAQASGGKTNDTVTIPGTKPAQDGDLHRNGQRR
jgi:putative drug exporter of the RND superfamily